MTDEQLQAIADEELMRRMDAADDVERLLQHEGWKPFEEAIRRIGINAEEKLRKISPMEFNNQDAFNAKVAELQIMAKLYRDILPGIKNKFMQDRDEAFRVADERGIIAKAVHWFQNRAK